MIRYVITFVRSVGLRQLLKKGGHCGCGGSDWARGADGWGLVVPSLALFVLIAEGPVGWKGMAALPVAGVVVSRALSWSWPVVRTGR